MHHLIIQIYGFVDSMIIIIINNNKFMNNLNKPHPQVNNHIHDHDAIES